MRYHQILSIRIATRPEDIASLVPTESLQKLCSDVPSTDNPLLMAELIGLCLSELSYENN